MNSIKFKFLKSTDYLIVLLISILGFSSSCKKEEVRYEYGSPHASFIVRGKIESVVNNTLIPDIIVEMRMVKEINGGLSDIRLTGTGFSDTNGNYSLSDGGTSPEDRTYQIKFTDTDGALNGEYETLDTTVVFKDPVFTNGDGSWYRGSTEKELNIKLKPKK